MYLCSDFKLEMLYKCVIFEFGKHIFSKFLIIAYMGPEKSLIFLSIKVKRLSIMYLNAILAVF